MSKQALAQISKGLKMDESEVLHVIDRALTDLLPDKHQYEADLQLYLDYSLPPHPELPSMEEEQISKHYADVDITDDAVLERDWPGDTRELEQQPLHGHDRQLAVLTEYTIEESASSPQDARSAANVRPETASELNYNADDSQALRDVSAAPARLHLADKARDEQPRGALAATPETIPRASVHQRFSQADAGAGDATNLAVEDDACVDIESLLDRKEGRAPEETDSEAELLQDQGAIIDKQRQATLARNAKPVAGRNWAAPYA